MSHEFETGLFCRGLAAWHKLGLVVEQGHEAELNASVAASLAGIDWSVSLIPAQLPNGMVIPGVRAIVRDSDSKVLGSVGKVPCAIAKSREVYEVYQNETMVAWIQRILDAGMGKLEAAASLYGGQRTYMLIRLHSDQDNGSAEVLPGDSVNNHWLMVNAFDGQNTIRVARCRTRVECANKLATAMKEGQFFRFRHSQNMFEALDDLQAVMMKEHEAFQSDIDVFKSLAKKNITSKILREYVQSVFPESFKEKKETAAERKEREKREYRDRWMASLNKKSSPSSTTKEAVSSEGKDLVASLLNDPPSSQAKNDEPILVSDIFERIEELVETGRGTHVPGVKGSMWGAYNAVVEYLQYEHGRGDRGITERRMDNMVFSDCATWNALALQKAQTFGK